MSVTVLTNDGLYVCSDGNCDYRVFVGGARLQVGSYTVTFVGGWFLPGGAGGITQVYLEGTYGSISSKPCANTSSAFPAGSVPICYLNQDASGRIQQIIDARNSVPNPRPQGDHSPNGSDWTMRRLMPVPVGDGGA
jgi:hypothetical protein